MDLYSLLSFLIGLICIFLAGFPLYLSHNTKALRQKYRAFMGPNPDIFRPLNSLEQNLKHVTKTGTLWVLHSVEASGPFTTKLVQEALSVLQHEHPLLSACIVRDEHGLEYWKKTNDPVVLDEERSMFLGEENREYLLGSLVPTESLVILPESRPMWRVKWIKSTPPCNRHLFVFHINHILCDGHSLMHITRQFLGHCHELHQGVTVSELWKRHPPYSVPDIFQLVELELGWRNYVQHLQAFSSEIFYQ
eukprot:TRINITY_DN3166_c0_g4_i4.p1 TRINITY_DN3166_c0_g4~~TRINITY_DN3166_c0_g4_i4.p1  ORF type:complete len:258 (+),score=13.11 TRINITY_DN3166_c0_g4_i4:30-776(+)